MIDGEETLFSKILIRFVIAVFFEEATELLLNHVLVLLFKSKEGCVAQVVAVAVEGVDLAAEAFVSFSCIFYYYFEVSVVLQEYVIHQPLAVL